MYIGHVAIALGAKRAAPAAPVLALALAAIAPDVGDIAITLAGFRHSWYVTHTVPGCAGWAIGAALIGWLLYGRRAALVLGALAASHVPLDYITSRIGVLPSGPHVGLGLYERPAIDLAIEAVVITAGWLIYRTTLAPERRRHAAVFALGGVMVACQVAWALIL